MAGIPSTRIEPDDQARGRQTESLAALAAVLALIVAGLFLVHVLHDKERLDTCLMSGRPNCDAMLAHAR